MTSDVQSIASTPSSACPCPLCSASHTRLLDQNEQRSFMRCTCCQAVFVPQHQHLSMEEEKRIYDYHENDPNDLGYRRFLNKLAEPLIDRLPKNARGLDFGCGPGPTLSLILRESGHKMSNYDLYYLNDPSALQQHYEFVTATEVVEHFREPSKSFDQLISLLEPGGNLGLMTKLIPSFDRFSKWHYTRDLTHVCFYHQQTFEYLAARYECSLYIKEPDVIILQKNG